MVQSLHRAFTSGSCLVQSLRYAKSPGAGAAPPCCDTIRPWNPAGILPERPYTKDEMLTYLEHGRGRCRAAVAGRVTSKGGDLG